MESKVTADNGVEVTTGLDDKAARRRQSAFARRKSSAVVEETAAIVEAHTLNDADRRLAEMGYTQVRLIQLFTGAMLTIRPILGIQARIFLAVDLLLRPLRLRPLRQCLDNLHLSIRGRWCIFSRVVLADFWVRMLLHCLVRG